MEFWKFCLDSRKEYWKPCNYALFYKLYKVGLNTRGHPIGQAVWLNHSSNDCIFNVFPNVDK